MKTLEELRNKYTSAITKATLSYNFKENEQPYTLTVKFRYYTSGVTRALSGSHTVTGTSTLELIREIDDYLETFENVNCFLDSI